ncbi:hypothetical protein Pcinc_017692 [Petrolisthes cinctipes]|uniref:Uncharacterized protein n=1 Tax=Petrolisthes cinctipes TaxID=88211 RepID=A0AAE1KMI7_PETCI|nr:hypothetical protein Pcinc_017692 [Petrolisthes cinctipes]
MRVTRMGVLVCVILVVLFSAVGVCGLYMAPNHARETRQVKVVFGRDKDRNIEGRIINPSLLECGKCEIRLSDGRCRKIFGCDDGGGGGIPFLPF